MSEGVDKGLGTSSTKVDRRRFIEAAVATGGITWAAPAVLGMSSGAAGAAHSVDDGCYRYMYAYSCFDSAVGQCKQVPGSNVEEDPSNWTCCKPKTSWEKLPDAPLDSVKVEVIQGTCSGGTQSSNPFKVKFTANPGYWLISPTIQGYSPGTKSCPSQTPQLDKSSADGGGLWNSFEWKIGVPTVAFPYYFTFYVYHGIPGVPGIGGCVSKGNGSKDFS
ncbi:MAG: hypothetical protein GY698_04690 [Actinomycetia bacterium]|nr:hypothetical protein [Actinomycetes bacterium]